MSPDPAPNSGWGHMYLAPVSRALRLLVAVLALEFLPAVIAWLWPDGG